MSWFTLWLLFVISENARLSLIRLFMVIEVVREFLDVSKLLRAVVTLELVSLR